MGTVRSIAAAVTLTREARITLHNGVNSIGPGNLCGLKAVDMEALRAIDRVQRTLDVASFGSAVTAETRSLDAEVEFAEADLRWLVDRMRGCTGWQGVAASVVVPLMDTLEGAMDKQRERRASRNGEGAETRTE